MPSNPADPFRVPTEQDLLETLGIESEPVGDEEYVRSISLTARNGQRLSLTYDIPAGSIRLQLSAGSGSLVDMVREGASLMSVYSTGGSVEIHLDFRTGSTAGGLSIRIGEDVRLYDQTLVHEIRYAE